MMTRFEAYYYCDSLGARLCFTNELHVGAGDDCSDEYDSQEFGTGNCCNDADGIKGFMTYQGTLGSATGSLPYVK